MVLVFFSSAVSSLIFFLLDLSITERGMLKSLTAIVETNVSVFRVDFLIDNM